MTKARVKALHALVHSKYPDALAVYIDLEYAKGNRELVGIRIRLKNSRLNLSISEADVGALLKEVS